VFDIFSTKVCHFAKTLSSVFVYKTSLAVDRIEISLLTTMVSGMTFDRICCDSKSVVSSNVQSVCTIVQSIDQCTIFNYCPLPGTVRCYKVNGLMCER